MYEIYRNRILTATPLCDKKSDFENTTIPKSIGWLWAKKNPIQNDFFLFPTSKSMSPTGNVIKHQCPSYKRTRNTVLISTLERQNSQENFPKYRNTIQKIQGSHGYNYFFQISGFSKLLKWRIHPFKLLIPSSSWVSYSGLYNWGTSFFYTNTCDDYCCMLVKIGLCISQDSLSFLQL